MKKNSFSVSIILFLFFSVNFHVAAQTNMTLDAAIQNTARDIESRLPKGTSLTMVNIVSGSPVLSDYIIEELTMNLMDSGNLIVVDRNTLNRALVNAEIDLQLSGDVSDETMVSIGILMGSQYALYGSLSGSGNVLRFDVFLTEAKTKKRQSLGAKNVQRNERLTALMNQKSKPEPKIATNPLTADEFINRANVFYEKGDYAKALADYTEALKLNTNQHFWVPYNRGILNFKLGKYNEAIADFTLAIERNGEYGAAIVSRGKAYIAIENFDKALVDFTRAIQITPNLARPYILRSTTYFQKGDYDKALSDSLYAVKLEPDYANGYMCLCTVYMGKGELEKAEEAYRTVLRLDPKYLVSDAKELLCTLYLERGIKKGGQGNHNAAIADFTRVIGIDPTIVPALANRGMGYYNLGEFNKAIADLELAVKYQPNNNQYRSALDRVRNQRDIEAAWGN